MFRHKKTPAVLALLAVLCLQLQTGVLSVPLAHAQTTTDSTLLSGFVEAVSLVFSVLEVLAYVALKLLSYLIETPVEILSYSGGTSGSTGLGDTLNQIWQGSRDITNAVLAFALVIFAFYGIVTAGTGNGADKGKLFKLMLSIVLVNFSWWFPRVILDTANVLTATVYNLPSFYISQMPEAKDTVDKFVWAKQIWLFPDKNATTVNASLRAFGGKWLEQVVQDATGIPPDECFPSITSAGGSTTASAGASGPPTAGSVITPVEGMVCAKLATLDSTANTGLGVLHGLYLNHGGLLVVDRITTSAATIARSDAAMIRTYIRFAIMLMFRMVYLIALIFPIISLMVVFAMRMMLLFLTMAFMPFAFIGFAFTDSNTLGAPKKIFDAFIASAFIPVITAIPIALGYVIISVGSAVDCRGLNSKTLCENIGGDVFYDIDTWWELLWRMSGVFVMWLGFFMVLKSDSIYGTVGNIMANFSNGAVGLISKNLGVPVPVLRGGKPTIEYKKPFARLPDLPFGKSKAGDAASKLKQGSYNVATVNSKIENSIQAMINNPANRASLRNDLQRELKQSGVPKEKSDALLGQIDTGLKSNHTLEKIMKDISAELKAEQA